MTEPVPASPPDLAAIVTGLAVLVMTVVAAVTGIWKGLQLVGKGGEPTGKQIASATLIETTTLTMLAESNRDLAEQQQAVIPILQQIERHLDRLCDAMPAADMRERAATEEMHRLRVATTDLHQEIRRGNNR